MFFALNRRVYIVFTTNGSSKCMNYKQDVIHRLTNSTLCRLWPLLMSNDLCPPPVSTAILEHLLTTGKLHSKYELQLYGILFELKQCIQPFRFFISVDLKWPLTPTNCNGDLVLDMGKQYTVPCRSFKQEHFCTFWANIFLQSYQADLCWPPMIKEFETLCSTDVYIAQTKCIRIRLHWNYLQISTVISTTLLINKIKKLINTT